MRGGGLVVACFLNDWSDSDDRNVFPGVQIQPSLKAVRQIIEAQAVAVLEVEHDF